MSRRQRVRLDRGRASSRSQCSTRTPRRAATSSTPPTCTRPGCRATGGESETIIGRWIAAAAIATMIVVATKVGMLPATARASRPATIRPAAEASLRRLAPIASTSTSPTTTTRTRRSRRHSRAFDRLVKEGKVRHVAASNYSAPRLAEALAVSRRERLPRYVALQPHYNLVHREEYEGELREVCERKPAFVCAVLCAGERVSHRKVPARRHRR